jgi:murein DD-endopeptidase MepM/ murein hydrolase activator NlpD
MNPWNRIRGTEDTKTFNEKPESHSRATLAKRPRRFVRGRLLRISRRTGVLRARIAAAARRRIGVLAESIAPARDRAAGFFSPRLSRAGSALRIFALTVSFIVGSPVLDFASFVSEKLDKRFGVLGRKAFLGAGGFAVAALVLVCALNLQQPSTAPAAESDAKARTLAADANGESAQGGDSEETPEATSADPEEAKPAVWELRINDLPVVTLASREEAESVLERVKASYANGASEIVEAEIKEDVRITETFKADAELADADAAVSYILTGTKEPKIHVVQSGDTLWDISRDNGISQEELVNSNPGLVPNKLKIGQQINLYETKPYLTIRTVEIASEVEFIDFQTNYQNSDELYKGQTQVLIAGVPGTKTKQTQITKENGIVVESVEIASAVTAEPQPQTSLVGTKPLETFTGSGQLISPLTHIEISSGFGSRGKRRHLGIDMRSPKGSPIYAADGGVVTTSAYKGSYGNLVVLNHGNGLETYYAHCDTLLVSVGDVVAQGQQIGTVGITGNATGYHLHFEVRINGVYQNPINYL